MTNTTVVQTSVQPSDTGELSEPWIMAKVVELTKELVEFSVKANQGKSYCWGITNSYWDVRDNAKKIAKLCEDVEYLEKQFKEYQEDLRNQIANVSNKLNGYYEKLESLSGILKSLQEGGSQNLDLRLREFLSELGEIGSEVKGELKSIEQKVNFLKVTKGIQEKLKEVGKSLLGLLSLVATPAIATSTEVSKRWHEVSERTKELIKEQVRSFQKLGELGKQWLGKLTQALPNLHIEIRVELGGKGKTAPQPQIEQEDQEKDQGDQQREDLGELSKELYNKLGELNDKNNVEITFETMKSKLNRQVQQFGELVPSALNLNLNLWKIKEIADALDVLDDGIQALQEAIGIGVETDNAKGSQFAQAGMGTEVKGSQRELEP